MKATFAPGASPGGRGLLGSDDVPDPELERMVADLWGVTRVHLVDSVAETVAYDVPSILTGARTWVTGRADDGDGPRPFRLFVKRVHHWRHSPAFAFVPPEVREWAAASLPWRAEHLLYSSDLDERLPEGLSMPRALRVVEHDDETAVLWLEAVPCDDVAWTAADSARAARLLGRLQDLGWVPFSPTDARRAPDSEEVVERGGGDEPGPGATPDDDAVTGTGDDTAGAAPAATDTGRPTLVVAAASGGAVLAVLLVVLLALLLARTLRSRRHRTRGAVGAWSEGRDALRLAGMPLAPHLTADQVASLADKRLRTDAVGVLAERTQRSAFAPAGADDPPLEVAGALRDVRRVARASLPRWRRWWWPFDPSVFLR